MDSLVHKAATGGRERPYASPPGMELSDFASESVIVSDEHGVIQYWNAASEALYGWPAMAMIGRNFAALCAPGQYDAEQHKRAAAGRPMGRRGPSAQSGRNGSYSRRAANRKAGRSRRSSRYR